MTELSIGAVEPVRLLTVQVLRKEQRSIVEPVIRVIIAPNSR